MAVDTPLHPFEVRRTVAVAAVPAALAAEQQVTVLGKDRVVVTAVADQIRVGACERESSASVVEMAELEALLRVAALASRRE